MDGYHPTPRYSPSPSAKAGINHTALIHPDGWESDIESLYTLCTTHHLRRVCRGYGRVLVLSDHFCFRNHNCKARKSVCECCTIARRSKLLVTASMEAAASRMSVISSPQFAMDYVVQNSSQSFTILYTSSSVLALLNQRHSVKNWSQMEAGVMITLRYLW